MITMDFLLQVWPAVAFAAEVAALVAVSLSLPESDDLAAAQDWYGFADAAPEVRDEAA